MPSLFQQGKRWVLQVNELPSRPRRFFRWKKHAEELKLKIEMALDRRDLAAIDRLLCPRGRETLDSLVKLWLQTGKPSRTEKQTRLKATRLQDALNAMSIRSPTELTLDAAAGYIKTQKDSEAPKTTNERVAILKSFSRWLHLSGRTERDALALLQRVDPIPTYRRAALSPEEVAGIMAAALVRSLAEWRERYPGASESTMGRVRRRSEKRQLLVAILFAAGMRVDELRTTTWVDLHLDDCEIVLPAERVKTRRLERVFLAPWLAEKLREHRDRIVQETGALPNPRDAVIHIRSNPQVPARKDAAYFGLDIDDPDARVDLHCLRHSLTTWLAEQGVDPHLADLFTRHAPQGSTRARKYLRGRAPTMQAIAARIPNLFELMSGMVSTSEDDGEHGCPRLLQHAPKKNRPKPPGKGDLGQFEAS